MNTVDHTTPRGLHPGSGGPGLLPVFVLALWLVCLTVGWLGFVLPYTRPKVVCYCEEPVEVKRLEVELTPDEIKLAEAPPPEASLQPSADSPAPPPVPPPSAPVTAVAPASAAVAFALPVLNPSRIAPTAPSASYIVPAATPAPAAALPAPTTITFGHGEGRQPAPKYPRQSVREGQEGTVGVRFSVGPDGRVLAAEASAPSPWSALNREALRVIREEWRFEPGTVRRYEISIVFQLTK
jgi:TonB family protein